MFVYCLMFSFLDTCMFFFFFKQKTAYEMRISDWSSDVCSSDLMRQWLGDGQRARTDHHRHRQSIGDAGPQRSGAPHADRQRGEAQHRHRHHQPGDDPVGQPRARALAGARSEEHTSELQSLMRSSYAVFCLKKKNKTDHNTITKQEETWT